MLDAFIMVLREGFEAFLIVAIIISYLRTIHREKFLPAVYSAIAVSVILSIGLGYWLMEGGLQPLWEAIIGLIAAVMVATLVFHMWKTGPRLKRQMEKRLSNFSSGTSSWAVFGGIFLFTTLMITREGMETAMMLFLVHDPQWMIGSLLGLGGAAAIALIWVHFSHLINLKRFFQVTGIFLLLFMAQIILYSIHEFSEAGLLPNSEIIHAKTEIFSPVGLYGKWFSLSMVIISLLWLTTAWMIDRFQRRQLAHQITVRPV